MHDCLSLARALPKQAFLPRQVSHFPLGWIPAVRRFGRVLLTVLLDSKYPSDNIEAALKNVFGRSRSIADWSAANEMGLHVGMPVTTTEDATTFVMTNYNGVGDEDDGAGQYNGAASMSVTNTEISGLPYLKTRAWHEPYPFMESVST